MNLLEKLKAKFAGKVKPEHLRRGDLGEQAAKKFLQQSGLKFLVANFRSKRGEVDLIFRDGDCLCFIEVKARSSELFGLPVEAVTREKRQRLRVLAAKWLDDSPVRPKEIRFDVVAVLRGEVEVFEGAF